METNSEEFIGVICPICGKEIKRGEGVVKCPECGQAQHVICYKNVGKCGGCDKKIDKNSEAQELRNDLNEIIIKQNEVIKLQNEAINQQNQGTSKSIFDNIISIIGVVVVAYIVYLIFFASCPDDFSDYREYANSYSEITINGNTMTIDLTSLGNEGKEIFNEVIDDFDFDESVTYEKVTKYATDVKCGCDDKCCRLTSYSSTFLGHIMVKFELK